MKKYRILLLWVVISLFGVACKKDSEQEKTSRQDLISRLWRFEQVLVNQTPSPDDFSAYRFDFRKDGTYESVTSFGSGQGKWELSSNGQQLILDKGMPNEDVGIILVLNATQLHLEFTQNSPKMGEQVILFKLIQ